MALLHLRTLLSVTLAAALAHFEDIELIDPGRATELIVARGAQLAGRQLNATYNLEGSLQIAMGKARIGVELIDVDRGQRVWSETFDRSLDDIFALQDEIAAFVPSFPDLAILRNLIHAAVVNDGFTKTGKQPGAGQIGILILSQSFHQVL